MAQSSGRRSPEINRPNMSSRRIVLLGRTGVGKSAAGKTILGEKEFKYEQSMKSVTCECSVKHATVSGRSVSVVDTPGLFHTDIKPEKSMTEIMKIIDLSSPGPHAFLIVFPVNMRFTEQEQQIPQQIEMMFGQEVLQYSIVLFTHGDLLKGQNIENLTEDNCQLRHLLEQCGGRFHVFNNRDQSNREQVNDLLQKIDTMIEQNGGGHYSNQMFEDALRFKREEEERKPRDEEERKQQEEEQRQAKIERVRKGAEEKTRAECEYQLKSELERLKSEKKRKKEERKQQQEPNVCSRSEKQNLILVLCGCDTTLKSSMLKLLMRKNTPILAQASQSVRMWSDVELHGRQISLVELPALNRLSEEEVMCQTLRCVSLCDPGVHAFLLIIPDAPLNNEYKAEIEKIQKIFDSREHFILHFTTDLSVEEHVTESINSSSESQRLISLYGDQYRVMGLNEPEISRQIPDLLDYIENMTNQPYSLQMYVKAQENRARHELEEQHKKEMSEMENKIKDLKQKIQPEGSVNVIRKQKMNLALCGSDETLKTSISNLIRKKNDELHGRQISLVKLPALSQLSEQEVMCQSLNCVSLCHPGVHVFLLIIPDAPLTDEDKAEMEMIQRIFSSRINKHIMTLRIKDKNMISKLISKINSFHSSDTETEAFIQTFGDHHLVLKNSSQVSDLLQDVENLVKQNDGSCYTTFMYLQYQIELERNKHRAEIEKLRRSVMKTAAGVTNSDDNDGGNGVRIVLLGKTGVGKSATGNTILRRDAFISKLTSRSVTRECQKETSEFNRRHVTVIDTPGLFDTGVDNVETRKEIVKCISMAAPGPHVFLLVIPLGRFTQEEKDTVKMIQEMFGEDSRMYTMVLFTRGDDLRETRIEDFIEDDDIFKNLILQCGHRYHVFNNNETKDQMQVSELLDKIDCMVAVNGGSSYTSEMFQQVEKNIKEEQDRIMKEKEEEIKRKEEELRTKYEVEIEQMNKENERERQEMQNELRKSKEEFKKREEEIKKETDENVRKEMKRKLEKKQREFKEENKIKEKALEEQQQKFIKYLEENHEKDKQKLQEKIQRETREQAQREYCEKLKEELDKALCEAEEKHETEKAKALQEVKVKYETEVAEMLQKVDQKHEAEKAKALQENEDKYKTEVDKILQEAEKNQEREVAKALQEAEENHNRERDKVLQETEEKHKKEKAEALLEAEGKHKKQKDEALHEAEEKHKTERVKVLKEAEEKHMKEKAEAEAKLPYRSKLARDWSYYFPVLGGAVGGLVGSIGDIIS